MALSVDFINRLPKNRISCYILNVNEPSMLLALQPIPFNWYHSPGFPPHPISHRDQGGVPLEPQVRSQWLPNIESYVARGFVGVGESKPGEIDRLSGFR